MKNPLSVSVKNQCIPLFLLVLFISVIPTASGKDFWEKKAYKEWSEKDCRKMLEDSP